MAMPRRGAVGTIPRHLGARFLAAQPAWLAPAATALGALAWCTLTAVTDPTRPGSGLPTCPFKTLTGLSCPGCGSTRMLHTLLHGDIVGAARYNVVALFMLPVFLWSWLAWTSRRMNGPRVPTWRPSPRLMTIAFTAWMIFAVLRNLPFEPWSSLRV